MELHITENKTIDQIQKEFSQKFPYLKIEFFNIPHSEGEASPMSGQLPPSSVIGKIRKKHNGKKMVITAHSKVADIEKRFQEVFGLPVQVFRKSGDVWLQTTITDHWTLAEQNEEGRESLVENR
jgi:hypothetical protein